MPGVSPMVNGGGREKQIMNPADPEKKRGSGGQVCSVPHDFLHLLTSKLASTYFIYSPASLPEPPSDWTAFPWAWTLSVAQKNSQGRILCVWTSTTTAERRREEREGLMCCAQEARPNMEMHVSACLYMEAHISNTHIHTPLEIKNAYPTGKFQPEDQTQGSWEKSSIIPPDHGPVCPSHR